MRTGVTTKALRKGGSRSLSTFFSKRVTFGNFISGVFGNLTPVGSSQSVPPASRRRGGTQRRDPGPETNRSPPKKYQSFTLTPSLKPSDGLVAIEFEGASNLTSPPTAIGPGQVQPNKLKGDLKKGVIFGQTTSGGGEVLPFVPLVYLHQKVEQVASLLGEIFLASRRGGN